MLGKLSTRNKILLSLTPLALLVFVFPLVTYAAGAEEFIQGVIFGLVTNVFGVFTWMGGKILNFSVTQYVVGFGELYSTSGLGFSINSLWAIIRDIFNLTFIFGLVFIGFKMIFDSNDSNARRMLVSLILAALLVNFSLFITKFVIDFSNIAATQVASAFEVSPGTGDYDVSGRFMDVLGLGTLWNNGNQAKLPTAGGGWAYIFGTMILLLVAAFVFAAGGFLLAIRFVVLNIYMVLSPLMFLGWVFPGFSGVSRQYWSGFLSRAFVAPAYILMLYISYQVLVNLKGAANKGDLAATLANTTGANAAANFEATIPYFLLSCVFLIASLVVAQKMGAQGATSAIAIGKRASGKARQYAGSATLGTAAAVGRNTAGAVGNAATNNNNRVGRYINSRAQGSGLSAWAARRAQDVSSAAANSSFDARQVGGLGKATGLGEGKKGGFVKAQSERVKKEQERAKKYAYNDQAYDDYGVRPEFDEYQELQRRRNEAFESLAQTNDIAERQRLSEITRSLQEEIDQMEAGTVSQVERSRLQDPAAIANREAALREFNRARAQANSNYGQRLYAANLRTRYDNVPFVGGVEFISRNQTRDAAADAINRQAGQNPQERMIREFFAQQNPPAATP